MTLNFELYGLIDFASRNLALTEKVPREWVLAYYQAEPMEYLKGIETENESRVLGFVIQKMLDNNLRQSGLNNGPYLGVSLALAKFPTTNATRK